MTDIAVLADAPDTITLAGNTANSQVQIAKIGTFWDPRYGDFKITRADFSKWITNFNTLSKGDGRIGLPVDVDHSPEKKGETEAAGWITNLEQRGSELWATVEWNTLGQELVRDRRYAYLSPSYKHDFRDETGKSHGTALVGVALTNRPFLSMATVSLSRAADGATELPDESDSREHMPDFTDKILAALGIDKDADESAILSRIDALKQPSNPSPDTVDLDALAKSEGKVVLDHSQVATLLSDASAGRKALEQLTADKFDRAWSGAVADGRVLPAQKDTYVKLYEANADATLSALDSAAKILNTDPQGSGAGGSEGGTTLSAADRKDIQGESFGIDEDRARIHKRAVTLAAEKDIDYVDAVELAMSEGSVA